MTPPPRERRASSRKRNATLPASRGGPAVPDPKATDVPPFRVAAISVLRADSGPLAEVLRALTDSASLAIVIVTHGDGPSDLAPIGIAGSSQVVEAAPGMTLVPGLSYMVPHDRSVIVKSGRFAVLDRRRRRSETDNGAAPLFSSLADELGPAAIAVVLSGTSHAALEALRTVKQRGGKTIVQDPSSAVFDEAPRAAIAAGLADYVLPPAAIGRELTRLASRKESGGVDDCDGEELDGESGEADEPLRQVLGLLKSKFKLDLSSYKLTTIRRRVRRRMALSHFNALSDYVEYLRTSPDALDDLHGELFIHVTQFFRDPAAFQALREVVFPALIKGREDGEAIRIWVPGCSTGEEAYSIAMSLSEFLEEAGQTVPVQIFATDISEAAVQRARRGIYDEAAAAGVGAGRLDRFFERAKEGGYKVRKELRDLCVISRHDVGNNPPFAKLDLISCRNVLIYFGPVLQKRIIPIFHYALRDARFLWLGQSETPGVSSKLFTLVDRQHKIYAKILARSEHLTFPSNRFTADKLPATPSVGREKTEVDVQKSADQFVLFKYGPPGVVVDQAFDILQFRGRTAPYLQPPVGPPTQNLMKMAHPDLLPTLRRLVESAKQNLAVRKEGLAVDGDGRERRVNIDITPLNPLSAERDRRLLVLFEESPPGAALAPARGSTGRRRARRVGDVDKDQSLQQLQQEIDALREYQQTVVEQFNSGQEELTSANEELQATNEEFQSTNEELESAKEELQSANEELTTMNDELQVRNAELMALNEKLARGEDRFRLMIEGVKDYAIYMLDPEGCIISWNEGARRLKGYEASEILGHHYSRFFTAEDVAAGLPREELEQARIEGRYEAEGWRLRKDGSNFWANVVVTRINDSRGTLIGFSKVTRDLTERRRTEQELEQREKRFRLMISGVRDYAIFMLDADGRIASWNEGVRRLKGYEEEEVLGRHFSIFYPPEDVAADKVSRKLEVAHRKGSAEDEGWRVRKDGSRFWANVVITRMVDEEGNLIGFTKVTRDLTERRNAEQALKSANETLEARVRDRTSDLEDALRSRDQFLSIASHELKTPLTSLKLQLQMARRAVDSQGTLPAVDAARSFDRSLKQAIALEELVDDLLDVSRIQTGTLQLDLADVNVGGLVEDVAARFADQASHLNTTIEVDVEGGVVARWDQRRFAQVVVNLVSNALKYAPGSPIRISLRREGSRARIVVEDSGPGISVDHQLTIFNRFERAGAPSSVGGLGLGLFISRRITEAHGGTIQVQSEPGQGARFAVELPLVAGAADLRAHLGETAE
jgi:two-component system, chemotaxis family, CheB/CheR fusion protein